MTALRKTDLQKQFGASVRASRGRLDISQEELAERAGLHRTYVCDIERGARNVSLKSIEKIARALEVSLAELFLSAEAGPEPADGPKVCCPAVVDILFAEAEPGHLERVTQALRTANLHNRVHTVNDGAAALDFLFRTGTYAECQPARQPQMILLDLTLPKVSGLDVLKRVKSDARTRSIPVVVLAESKLDRNIPLSEQAGADAYIVKPIDFQNLTEVASRLNLQWALLKTPATSAH